MITKTNATPECTPPGSPGNRSSSAENVPVATGVRSNLLVVSQNNSMASTSELVSIKSNSKNLLSPQLSAVRKFLNHLAELRTEIFESVVIFLLN